MTWIKWSLVIIATVVVGLVAVGLFLPSSAHVERTTVIDATQSTVFALVNGFGRFNEWSPWHERDPATEYDYSGPAFGTGAQMAWSSTDPKVGSGSQEITSSSAFNSVELHLEFGDQSSADAFYRLTQVEAGTQITWGFDTDFGYSLIGRYVGRFSLDKLVGSDYEHGLANLKTLAESLPKADWTQIDVAVDEVEALPMLAIRGRAPADQEAIWATLSTAFATISKTMTKNKIATAGAPIAVAHGWTEDFFEFEAGIPYQGQVETEVLAGSPIFPSTTQGGRVVQAVHSAGYDRIPATYRRLEAFLAAHGFTPAGKPWETYLRNPDAPVGQQLITIISYPVTPPLSDPGEG